MRSKEGWSPEVKPKQPIDRARLTKPHDLLYTAWEGGRGRGEGRGEMAVMGYLGEYMIGEGISIKN